MLSVTTPPTPEQREALGCFRSIGQDPRTVLRNLRTARRDMNRARNWSERWMEFQRWRGIWGAVGMSEAGVCALLECDDHGQPSREPNTA